MSQSIQGSKEVVRSNLDYFSSSLTTDISIQSTSVENVLSFFPTTHSDTPIEFHIQASPSQFIDLRQSTLYLQVKILKADGTALTSSDSVSTINLLLHSLFSECEIILNQKTINSANGFYHVRSYIQHHFGIGSERKATDLTSALYYRDSTKTVNFTNDEGQKSRKKFIEESKVVELEGPICMDICQQTRYIPNNTQVRNFILLKPINF